VSSTPYFSVEAPIEALGEAASSFTGIRTDDAVTHASFVYGASSTDDVVFIATRAMRVKAAYLRPYVAGTDAGAVTVTLRKVPSGTAIAGGTALHTGTGNLKGTPDTVQTLTLSATAADLGLAAGDALAIDFTGVMTAARGVVTVGLAPR
jgi:hypothetical protein